MHGVGCPHTLWVLRHGQSAGNVARDEAEAQGLHRISIATRDIDTPLSELGRHQAWSVGHWFAQLTPEAHPQVLLCSPYVRARQTAELLLQSSGLRTRLRLDERLREKEFGCLDRLTRAGIVRRFPELHEQRAHVGKFYFRPPGGESWWWRTRSS
jgi:broad specificity phosphatase PhoE